MFMLITILSALFALFGIGLLFSPAKGAFIAGVVCIGAGAYAYDEKSFMPLVVGFGLLWAMRLLGIEKR
jgi:hypothetical protein